MRKNGAICSGFTQILKGGRPQIKIGGLPLTPLSVIIYVAWAGFCFFPVILGLLEDKRFEKLKKMADMERRLPWYLTDPKKMM